MKIPTRTKMTVGWLLLGALAAAVCSVHWSQAHLGNEYLPVGNDSFYHAARILDTAHDPSSFYEFDKKIHAPEGSLIVWPWGYDYAMGWLVRLGGMTGVPGPPINLLVWIPVAAVFLSIGLILLITRRLELPLWSAALAGLCVALSPLTQFLHGPGSIDHHYAEYIFALAMLAAGLKWLSNLGAVRPAIVLAAILGIAPAIHNGLFILQIPVLVALLALWLQRIRPPKRSTNYFCAAFIGATIAILIPSLPFRAGHFEFYTLSWFHLYVAFGTALMTFLFSRLDKTPKNLTFLSATALILILPLVNQIIVAHSFLAGTITRLEAIAEMQSIPRQALQPGGFLTVSKLYSLFIWLMPFTLIYCGYRCWHERGSARILFWISAIGGLSLLATQFRLHYFGSFALYLPWLIFLQGICERRPADKKLVMLLGSMTTLLLYAPPMRYQLFAAAAPANDEMFAILRPILTSLQEACAKDPGIVLADNDAGHYIRYYTECSVIANNFLLTKQHEEKIRLIDKLMGMSPTNLLSAEPSVKYVLVRPVDIYRETTTTVRYIAFNPTSGGLFTELLLKSPEAASIPPAYKLLSEVRLSTMNDLPYAKLYQIRQIDTASADR